MGNTGKMGGFGSRQGVRCRFPGVKKKRVGIILTRL
jgi:hypothetical protein